MTGEKKKKDKRKKDLNSPDSNNGTPDTKRFYIDMSGGQPPQASANFMYQGYAHSNMPYGQPFYGSPPPPPVGPTVSQSHMHMQQIPASPPGTAALGGDVVAKLFERLDMMDKKLCNVDKKVSQLESIESSLTKVTVQVNTMATKVDSMDTQLTDLKNSREFDSKTLEDMKKKQNDMDKMIKNMQKVEAEQKERLLDLQCRQMRDNLIFYSIQDERGESDEVCAGKLYTFFEKDLKLMSGRAIKLDRIHRLGRYNPTKTRPIIAKFSYYPEREMVRKAAKNLEGTNFSISQQFPKEIMTRRKNLIPTLKSLKDAGHRAYISVDKLYVDGELYTGELVQSQQQRSSGTPNYVRGREQGQGHRGRGRGRGWGNRYQALGSRDRGAYSRSPDGDRSQSRDSFRGQGHEQGGQRATESMETNDFQGHSQGEGQGQGQGDDSA